MNRARSSVEVSGSLKMISPSGDHVHRWQTIVTKRRDQANYIYKHLRYYAGNYLLDIRWRGVSLRSSRNKLICLDATIYRSLHYLRKAFSRINIMRFGWTWIYEVYSAMKFTGYVCSLDLIKQRLVLHFLFCLHLLFRSSPLANFFFFWIFW